MMTTPELISGAALIVSIGVAAWQRFGVILGLQKQIGDLKASTSLQITDKISGVKKVQVHPRTGKPYLAIRWTAHARSEQLGGHRAYT